jgi:catechol 2,3-dioxygenase-like lactoylglutathione lyase family enzyme
VILFAGVPVAAFESARAWYESFFGRPPDLVPHENEAAWRIAADGWVYVVRDAERAGNGLVTILVDDLEVRVDQLACRGIESGDVEASAGGVRKVTFTDPEGNSISLGHVPGN